MLTIIGAAAFHGPVRDGKGWFHRAMVIRHGWLLLRGPVARATRGPIRREAIETVLLSGPPALGAGGAIVGDDRLDLRAGTRKRVVSCTEQRCGSSAACHAKL